jgi:UDP-2-acetamido-3-amino-2,3-dideoxy-glucuronate N-acetyltransferase
MIDEKERGTLPGIAVIGTGYWGKNLVRNYAKLRALRMICDKNETVLAQIKKQYPDVDICLSLHDVLARKEIQGVVIATPAETHFTIAREALLAGKHVYVEKPLVLVEREAEELINIAHSGRRILMVGHLLQYHPVFNAIREMVLSGELGRINYIYSHRLNLGKIRREENILWSFAPHDISMILSIAGEDPEYVLSTGAYYLHQRIADVTTTHLEFTSGLRAHIFVSWLHPFKEQKLVIVGDRKMAVFDDTKPWTDKLHLYSHTIRWENNLPVTDRGEPERFTVSEAEPLLRECEQFLHSIRTGEKPFTDGQEGLRVLRVLTACQRSLNQNGQRVQLPTADHQPAAESPATGDTDTGTCFIHKSAVVDDRVSIGQGTKIWHFSHVLTGSFIGNNCNIGQNVVIGPDVTIGKGCKIQNNISIYKGVTLEDDVFCGPSMVFTNVINPRAHIRRMEEIRPTLVQKGATLGANCTIVCGHRIGRYAFIGAGSVVTGDVPDHALMMGNPAKQVGWVCTCGSKLDKKRHCPSCGLTYDID